MSGFIVLHERHIKPSKSSSLIPFDLPQLEFEEETTEFFINPDAIQHIRYALFDKSTQICTKAQSWHYIVESLTEIQDLITKCNLLKGK